MSWNNLIKACVLFNRTVSRINHIRRQDPVFHHERKIELEGLHKKVIISPERCVQILIAFVHSFGNICGNGDDSFIRWSPAYVEDKARADAPCHDVPIQK